MSPLPRLLFRFGVCLVGAMAAGLAALLIARLLRLALGWLEVGPAWWTGVYTCVSLAGASGFAIAWHALRTEPGDEAPDHADA